MILQDKTAIVTGAGSGIGRAVAVAYAREGGRVIVSDISEQGGRETVRLIEEATPGARSVFVRADASNPDDHEMLVQAALDQFGALHVACNNAGIGGELNPVGDLSVNCWKTVVELNLSGVFYAMRAQIPRILPPRPPSARGDITAPTLRRVLAVARAHCPERCDVSTCHRAAMRMCGQRPLARWYDVPGLPEAGAGNYFPSRGLLRYDVDLTRSTPRAQRALRPDVRRRPSHGLPSDRVVPA